MQSTSQRILSRIDDIKINIRHYEDNIKLLKSYQKYRNLEGAIYTDGALNYVRTKEDDVRSRYSINNLKEQIKLLKLELNILKEYAL